MCQVCWHKNEGVLSVSAQKWRCAECVSTSYLLPFAVLAVALFLLQGLLVRRRLALALSLACLLLSRNLFDRSGRLLLFDHFLES